MAYPSTLDTFSGTATQGTSLLTSPDHAADHRTLGSAANALEQKLGVGVGTPKADYALIGQGNGTSTWGTVWNNANLGTPIITGGTITSATLTTVSMVSGTIGTGVTGFAKPFVTVGTSEADYITDGTADEVQIQDAIASLGTVGGEVYIKSGTYTLSWHLDSSGLIPWVNYYCVDVPSNVHITGAGVANTYLQTDAFTVGTFGGEIFYTTESGRSNIKIENMTLAVPSYATADASNAAGFISVGCSNITLRDLSMINGGWAIRGGTYSYSTATKVLTTDSRYATVENVRTTNGLGSNAVVCANDIFIKNCQFLSWADDPFLISTGGQNIIFEDCLFDGESQTSDGSSTAGLYILNDAAVSAELDIIKNITIKNCTIKNWNLPAGNCRGISIALSRDILIDGNLIENVKEIGIDNSAQSSKNITIVNNTIRQNGSDGIAFRSAANCTTFSLLIANNRIYNNGAGSGIGISAYSSDSGGTLSGITVIGNEVYDNAATAKMNQGIIIYGGGSGTATNGVFVGNNTHDLSGTLGLVSGFGTAIKTGNLGGW